MSVFLSHGADGASLDELLGTADAINHAIPTAGELSDALTRLASCGILTETQGRYRIAAAHLPELAKAQSGKGGLFRTSEKGRRWLARTKFKLDHSVRIMVTQKELSLAYELYRKRIRHGNGVKRSSHG